MGKTSKREKKSKKHKHKKSKRKHKKNGKDTEKPTTSHSTKEVANESGFEIPVKLMNTKSHTPITPQEYRERQSQMRRVVDPTTGRVRLIRGEGEVMEEIVSREQHAKINSLATKADGQIFQQHTIGTVKKPK
ncbi:ADP-ribosylation factor-like protein 6-interacting protein 4 [Anastrepha obliqua]|uniref:ADP-ribosylation factor-like protein 6-interacting protein 4 n=1 Tax=Anastrepha obliqua TaxID=95512 RepID=UPI00240A3947|nr:ADP-ribosylation factor-like protein 6-interacting protein 4 [Anastrepha obliqua]